MLGDIVELSVAVRDLDAAVERYSRLFGLQVRRRDESKEFGFKNAILPTGIGHIELLQPTDPTKPVGRFLDKHGRVSTWSGSSARTSPGPSPSCARMVSAWTARSRTSPGSIPAKPTASSSSSATARSTT